jgi:putative ABC transport system substrate-binding protein
MDRRRFLLTSLAGAVAVPLAVEAQSAAKVYRIGFLSSSSSSAGIARLEAFKHGLRELGYLEGQNLAIEYRWAEGKNDRLPALAADLVRLRVDVIVTQGTLTALAARRTTSTIPIVFTVAGDPLRAGLIASLARPGGNVTGLAVMGSEMTAKRLELLREAVPALARIAVLWNSANPSSTPEFKETETAARALGMQAQSVEVKDASMLDRAFAAMIREQAKAIIVLSDNMLFGQRKQIAHLAAHQRLAGIAWTREFAEDGGLLMVYGPDISEMHRRAAAYVGKILRGANPADLPVEQPTKFELVINLKTAKALGLTIPPSLLARADQVIE